MEEKQRVYIRGNIDRGEEVIKALETLGGYNGCSLHGDSPSALYFIDHDKDIFWVYNDSEMANIIKDCYKELKLPEQRCHDGDILDKFDN